MNYGRFFRLNRSLSEIENGIAIYDYVDLPAYFTPSEDNHMSPKYPISVIISSSSVIFRLHYSAFKIEEKNKIKDGTNNNYPYYTYDSDDLIIDKEEKYRSGDIVKVAHMEEVILELPFVDNATSLLSDTIKDIYSTPFPQLIENTSTGGRFLEQLINKRYPKAENWESLDYLKKKGDVENLLYGTLREASDNSPSYSTLWLMDLMRNVDVKGHKNTKRINLYDEKDGESIIAFLRKLLLDFMFDLKHSDIFQNSVHYQKMYSGLMSDFYFSALMHKCEYYYYRKLTSKAIEDNDRVNKLIPKEQYKKEIKKGKETIASLYASELIKAEDLWIQDIMNPQAEKDFEHRYPGKHNILREFFEYYNFKQWPSWFAEPEEEMRRVCFTMKDKTGERHICNTDTLINYLELEKHSSAATNKMIRTRDDNRETISRWLLKRYDFNDVIHLHLFKHLNNVLFIAIIITLMWFFKIDIIVRLGQKIALRPIPVILCTCFLLCPFIGNNVLNMASEKQWSKVAISRFWLLIKRVGSLVLNTVMPAFTLYIIFVLKFVWYQKMATIVIYLGLLLLYKKFKILPNIHPISCLHLLFPRLVAAITAGWLTMSLGFDIYVSFFDSIPRWYTAIAISGVVFMFIMYEINRIMPSSSTIRKVYRSLEFLIISYCISLLVGVVVINFVGEKFLERGGYIGDYYEQHVDNNKRVVDTIAYNSNANGEILNDSQWVTYGKAVINRLNDIKDPNDIPDIKKVENLQEVTKDGHKIVEKKNLLGFEIYFMRDFLIMFSFIAMFWGIFIQMIFTGEKQMTEL